MKKIIPFKKEIPFKTKVSEITSISLEHTLNLKEESLISGEFHISGDYKMTEGSINKENFDYTLPFDIALDSRYDVNNIVIDIDDFYYEIIDSEALKVNIDVFVDGAILKEEEFDDLREIKQEPLEELNQNIINLDSYEEETITLDSQEDKMNLNFLENLNDTETYASYRVYIVKEEDNLDKILTKYGISSELLSEYNDLSDIKIGDKLIIPTIKNGQ